MKIMRTYLIIMSLFACMIARGEEEVTFLDLMPEENVQVETAFDVLGPDSSLQTILDYSKKRREDGRPLTKEEAKYSLALVKVQLQIEREERARLIQEDQQRMMRMQSARQSAQKAADAAMQLSNVLMGPPPKKVKRTRCKSNIFGGLDCTER